MEMHKSIIPYDEKKMIIPYDQSHGSPGKLFVAGIFTLVPMKSNFGQLFISSELVIDQGSVN